MNVFRVSAGMAFACISLMVSTCMGADGHSMQKAVDALKSMKGLSVYAYDYTVTNTYPNKQKQNATGFVCMDKTKKMLFEKGSYSTTLINSQWYYKAEHNDKVVTVINIDSYAKKHKGQLSSLDFLFETKSMLLPDSILLKHGRLISLTNQNNILTVKIKIDNVMNMDTYEVVYDQKKEMPVSIYIRSAATSLGGITYQEMNCSKFRTNFPPNCFSMLPYFEIKSDAVVLKQYKTYKPHFEL